MKRFIFACSVFFVLACSGRTFETSPTPEGPQLPPQPQPGLREGELRADGDTERTYDHIDNDDDRGKPNITDRQRNEIKTDGHSPASMVGQRGEKMLFRWKFRLPEGMKTTQQFCHVHQIKGIDNAAGTADVSMPVITFTARTLSNGKRQLQVIYVPPTAEGGGNRYLARADLEEFLGEWVEAEERIECAEEGSYRLSLRRLRDGRELLSVPLTPLAMWRDGAAGMRPKWGIYRSFGKAGALKPELRDEILGFADFEVKKEVQ